MTAQTNHRAPCPWTLGALGAVGLLCTVGGACLAAYALDIRELRAVGQTSREDIRGLQTDIGYIRDSLDRIEAALGKPRAHAPSPSVTPGAVAALPAGVTIP